ncbi:MAG: hypothetical protein WD533_05415 [Dehalococcoidia bacterium]
MGKRIGIVGTRFTRLHSPNWEQEIRDFIYTLPDDVEIIVNGAPGTDQAAKRFAEVRGLKVTELFPDADYSLDKRYFMHRNGLVVEKADEIHAFWDGHSAGTQHAIKLARHLKVPIHVHHVMSENWQRVG